MSVLYVTEPAEDGMRSVITDEPCECGWPETILHIYPDDRPTMRGCASCEVERPEPHEQGSGPLSAPAHDEPAQDADALLNEEEHDALVGDDVSGVAGEKSLPIEPGEMWGVDEGGQGDAGPNALHLERMRRTSARLGSDDSEAL